VDDATLHRTAAVATATGTFRPTAPWNRWTATERDTTAATIA